MEKMASSSNMERMATKSGAVNKAAINIDNSVFFWIILKCLQ